MRLSLDTSRREVLLVTLASEDRTIAGRKVPSAFGHAQVLIPTIQSILTENTMRLADITEIAVHTGPGSYTGLRVGASVAQTLAYALHIPVNQVDPLVSQLMVHYE